MLLAAEKELSKMVLWLVGEGMAFSPHLQEAWPLASILRLRLGVYIPLPALLCKLPGEQTPTRDRQATALIHRPLQLLSPLWSHSLQQSSEADCGARKGAQEDFCCDAASFETALGASVSPSVK